MFDLIALWIGRVILTFTCLLIILVFILIALFGLQMLCRRPYYCIKHLFPWKQETEQGWEAIQQANRIRCEKYSPEIWKHDWVFTRSGRFGILTDKGKHKWWEPVHRFYIIKQKENKK